MENKSGLTVKDLLIRLVLIVIFIFLLIWLFPMPDLKPLNNQIFADNIDRMKDVAKSYYTVERLPQDFNTSKKMTLKEMIDEHLILPLMDSNGNYCSEDDSYVQITKLENEYVIKVQLSCTDKKDYVIEHFGCYDICSDVCKILETTNKNDKTTNGKVTTKNNGKLYEYQFMKNECTEKFDKYVCPSGYYLVGNKCMKDGSQTVSVDAYKHVTNVSSTDTKDAKPIITSTDEKEPATCKVTTLTSTIDATPSSTVTDQIKTGTQTITADKKYSYDVKGAVGTVKTVTANKITVQNYDVISATKVATGYKWTYQSTLISDKSNLAFTNDNEKLVLVDSWEELACDTCFTTVTVYQYWRYKKEATGEYTYSCDAFPGYEKYDGNKCRKATTVTTKCPDGYTDNGSTCSKQEVTYSCSKYGSDYVLDENKKTCTKTTVSYSCPAGTTKTSDEKYCKKDVYGCPAGTTAISGGKCSKTTYSCPPNTSNKTYTLNGTKCTVKSKVKVCSCPEGTVQTEDKLYCIKTNSSTTYSCEAYPGYTLNGTKCTKTTTTQKVTYSCDSGYTLSGTKCVKTVSTSDTKDAEPTYRISCDQKYKWSTSTSIDGWIYTGNKREIK